MKNKIYNFLAHHVKWVFSGIGIVLISSVINNTCSNGAEDKKHTVINIPGNHTGIITGHNEGTINSGDKVDRDKVTAETVHYGDQVSGDKVLGDKFGGDKILGDKHIHNPPPSFRKVTVASNKEGNPIGIADNPSPIQNATKLLGKLLRGEEVKLQEASPSKFLINSGTEISILESDNSSEQLPTGFTDPIGFTQVIKIKILEGPHKGKTGWIHASMIHHEQREQ
ncbi:hypothetical protein VU04_03595 [Desulfobulbus sp. TB]|nr:hypothetical protein [Desulfobulbus sp. TB]